ncbi:hypothetical protein HX815_19285 [Pseudomonas sp. E6002]|uniref:hypothetical protein n=1 Tax=Pseudomonas sp. E6002 TaxID=2738820 RepID=UPI0015A1C38C|nr:hypothetical protein [Pseudomonas sp. E6002]NWB42463.1 hypothetical protein [Pseudomonas sp. E6002]
MSAKVLKKFDRRFELNEESIRRIYSDIKKRVPEENHKEIIFEIFREDSLIYRTSEIDRIMSEDNDSTRKIKSIKIEYTDNNLKLEISFDSENGTQFSVSGEDRDAVYLLSSELKEYIQKEVANIPTPSAPVHKIFVFSFTIIALILLAYLLTKINNTENTEILKSILESNDTNEKINYLINSRDSKQNVSKPLFIMFVLPILLSLQLLIPFRKIFYFLYPGNIFLFGKQISIIANRRSTSKNIFWGGIVAFIIAISTGYYFFWLAK